MRNKKPIIQIDKFSGSGDGLLYYNEGFVAGNENGNSLLTETFKYDKYWDTTDVGFSGTSGNYLALKGVLPLTTISGSVSYNIFIDASGQIFSKTSNGYSGYLNKFNSFGVGPDIIELPSKNILISAYNNGYFIIRGSCAAGSTTSKIVDSQGRDLLALGASGNKVQNLTTGAIYNITSISTTTSTNDTLNFTAQTGKEIVSGDEFFVYVYNKISLQPSKNNRKQIKQFGDIFYILNGNKLGRLEADESTFNDDYKLFPAGYEALSFDVNSGKMLFTAKNETGKCILILWDGASDGWNNIIDLDGDVYSVKSYQSGWVYVLRGVIYYTDGFSIQKISAYSDTVKIGQAGLNTLCPTHFNGIVIFNNLIYFINQEYNRNYDGLRTDYGVYCFDINSGWSFLAGLLENKPFALPQFISLANNQIFVGFVKSANGVDIAGVSIIKEGSYTNTALNKSFITYLELKNEMVIMGVGLTIGFNDDISKTGFSAETKTNITVSIGNGNQTLMKNYYGNPVSSSRLNMSRHYDPMDIGDELRFTDPGSLNNGKRVFITNKQLQTGADTIITVDPAILTVEDGAPYLKIIKVKKCATKTITEKELNREHLFFLPSPLFTNKIYIEVVVNGIDNSMPISITGINVY
jgi:hypothetical protein